MQKVLILDFGSQYTQLIARRLRELHVYCEIWPCTKSLSEIKDFSPQAIILSGGPASVLSVDSPDVDEEIFSWGIPILGICYGLQLIAKKMGGKLHAAQHREYGPAKLVLKKSHSFLSGIKKTSHVWMSHGDSIAKLPQNFILLAQTDKKVPAIIAHTQKKIVALQFHPEVHHTDQGVKLLKNFLFKIAKVKADWNMQDFIKEQVKTIRKTVGDENVILGLSGGVDSSVAAALIHKAIGNKLTCIFIDNGLLRQDEEKFVPEIFRKHFKMKLIAVNARDAFLTALAGVRDPEQKRKIIGKIFIDVFSEEAKKIQNITFLAQGTLYPDVIESVSFKGPSVVIKSHHNVGGLPEKLGFKLLEPLRELFKDEVRELGKKLKLPQELLGRHPFPGPGLGIRVLGEIDVQRVEILKKADAIALEEIRRAGWYDKIWQALAVLLPVQSVGVMGDERTYENVCAIRCVSSVDGMTADWVRLPYDLMARISARIINEVRGINRVVYDISSKPPATIEWE